MRFRTFWLLLLTACPALISAQFSSISTFGEAGNENGQKMVSDGAGGFYVAGNLDAPFRPLGEALPLYGGVDLFVGQVDAGGQLQWIKSGGSFLDDEVRVLQLMPDGDLILAGTFWLEFTYDELTLIATDNIKGIFVLRLDPQGQVRWGKVINGADLKEVSDLKIDPAGQIYLTGHFSRALQFEDLRLEAKGRNDAFLLKLDGNGALLSWQQLGLKGDTRGQALALHPDGGYYWGGIYNDTLRIDSTDLYANTFDADLFLLRCDADGQPLWARRAGGVFEEDLVAMTVDTAGDLLATGYLIGVMTLSENLSIQSRNGNPDIFLFKYDDSGQPLWARAIGGTNFDQPTSLCLLGESLIIGGTYQQQVAWDGFTTPATGGANGFVAAFRQADGSGQWLAPVLSADFAFVEAVSLDAAGQLYALGSFTGPAQFGNLSVPAAKKYDVFLAKISPGLTPVHGAAAASALRLYPNPAREFLHLEGLGAGPGRIQLYDAHGKLIKWLESRDAKAVIDLKGLPAGAYWLRIRQGGVVYTRGFAVIR